MPKCRDNRRRRERRRRREARRVKHCRFTLWPVTVNITEHVAIRAIEVGRRLIRAREAKIVRSLAG